jgi:hypothetical protein
MGMSSRIQGIREPDEKFKKFIKIIKSLEDAGLSWEDAPEEIQKFFDYDEPNHEGILIEMGSTYGRILHESVTLHKEEMEDGFVVDISKLPKNITKIRFVNNY